MHWRQPPAAVMPGLADIAPICAEPREEPGPVQAALLASLPALVLHLSLVYLLVVLVLCVLFRAVPRLRTLK